jgi:hypothetical protein
VDALVSSGVQVVGDPDTLRTVEVGGAGEERPATVAIDTVVRAVKGAVTADRDAGVRPRGGVRR